MSTNPLQEKIESAAEIIRSADALMVTAGAGMGVDWGLPDFRGNEGFWRAYPVAACLGLRFADLANASQFGRDAALAWGFYGHRLDLYRKTTPHPGFRQLLEIGESMPHGYFVFTSNVDGHFQKAGFDKDRIVECHGSIHYLQCADGCCDAIWPATRVSITVDMDTLMAKGGLPICRHCGGVARPNILMFNDRIWSKKRNFEQNIRLFSWWQQRMEHDCSVAVVNWGREPPSRRFAPNRNGLRGQAERNADSNQPLRVRGAEWKPWLTFVLPRSGESDLYALDGVVATSGASHGAITVHRHWRQLVSAAWWMRLSTLPGRATPASRVHDAGVEDEEHVRGARGHADAYFLDCGFPLLRLSRRSWPKVPTDSSDFGLALVGR